ncbi:hypothetical protein sos41_32800 [Alphaproteobacteria bacterium SO-S41]|nr:hypothetical protein sos41_32800 [Alphaproteobacteria bacterium SO-S41]
MTDPITTPTPEAPAKRRRLYRSLAGGAALLALGVIAGAGGWAMSRPAERVAFDPALATTTVATLADSDATKIEGRVTDIFGNKFVLEDATGRALVDTGRDGDERALVTKDEIVKVQGRFDRNELHATALQRTDGTTEELTAGPPRPPHDHAKGPHHHDDGPRTPHDGGPDHGPEDGPPPAP